MGLTGLVRVFWLLSAVSADLNPYRGVGNVQSEKIFNPCFFWADSKNPRLLSLAQHWETPAPSAVLSVHAVSTDSFESEFDLRTFDPEGIVFYGDVEEDGSWFVLALRNGRPEIQVNNKHSSIAVSSGDILNDGKWRRIYVKGRDNEISLVVDRKPILNIVILPNVGLESREASVRIAMGGLLINKSSLLIPLRHSLDACIANWDWLHQNTSWLLKKVANTPNIQCPNNIVPGTFFRGIGMAVFKGSDFLNESESSVDWSLRFEAVIRPVKHNGVVMAILTGAHDPLVKLDFSLRNQHEHFRLDLGRTTLINMPDPGRLCDGQRVTISVSENEATLQIGAQRSAHAVAPGDFTALRRSWFTKDALILLGGLPDDEKLGSDWHLFSGCMQEIRLQGTSVDFNQAWFKHNAISSHSCPVAVNQSPINLF